LLKHFASRRRVAIDTRDTQCGEELRQHLFELFRALADVVDVLLLAGRTHGRHCLAMVAVMTDHHSLTAVVRQRDVAVRTLNRLAARAAENKPRITAPVEQDDRLLVALVRRA